MPTGLYINPKKPARKCHIVVVVITPINKLLSSVVESDGPVNLPNLGILFACLLKSSLVIPGCY